MTWPSHRTKWHEQHIKWHNMTCHVATNHSSSPHVTSQPSTLLHLTPQATSWHQNRSHHHHGTAEGSFTAKKWFGHRAGRSPCAHSIGKFFLWLIVFFFETSAPGLSGHYWYMIYLDLCCIMLGPFLCCFVFVLESFGFVVICDSPEIAGDETWFCLILCQQKILNKIKQTNSPQHCPHQNLRWTKDGGETFRSERSYQSVLEPQSEPSLDFQRSRNPKKTSWNWNSTWFETGRLRVEMDYMYRHLKKYSCWFQIFFIFTPTWGRFPFWLIFFRWVETWNHQLEMQFDQRTAFL